MSAVNPRDYISHTDRSPEAMPTDELVPDLYETSETLAADVATGDTATFDDLARYDVLETPLRTRIVEDVQTLYEEATEPGHRIRRMSALALGGVVQGLDRFRAMVVAMPIAYEKSFIYAQEHGFNGYETAGLTGAALGGTFGVWSWIVGRSLQTSINAFPETTKTVADNHPVMVDVVADAVGGFVDKKTLETEYPKDEDGTFEVGAYDSRKSKLGKAALAFGRGLKSALLFGSTAYVGTAKVSDYSEKSTNKIRRAVTAESAAIWGGIAVGGTAAIENDLFGMAIEIRQTLENRTIWLGLAAASIGLSAVLNKLSRSSQLKKQAKAERLAELSGTDTEQPEAFEADEA
jgi:hypothetical protein